MFLSFRSSANVVPARSSVVEGLFYGVVIRVGPNTIVAKQNQSLASSKGPITSSHRRDWSFVRKACSMQLYPLNIEVSCVCTIQCSVYPS